jgi:hypothetical protein
VAEHLGDRVERHALPQGRNAGGVPQLMEADLYREAPGRGRSLEREPHETSVIALQMCDT